MNQRVSRMLVSCGLLLALGACSESNTAQSSKNVSFARDVRPILEAYCLECHQSGGAGTEASGLSMVDYDALMKGTKHGPIIKPGDSLSSTLIILVEGRADQSIRMPHGDRAPLSADAIQTLRRWIDDGAKKN